MSDRLDRDGDPNSLFLLPDQLMLESLDAMSIRDNGRQWDCSDRRRDHRMERAILLADGDELSVDLFPLGGKASLHGDAVELPANGMDLEQWERSFVVQALDRSGWNQTKAATLLGLNRDQIRYRIEKFKLERPA